jgi:hypothetical protein
MALQHGSKDVGRRFPGKQEDMMSPLDAIPSKEDIMSMLDALPSRKDIMSTLGALPTREEIAEMLRQQLSIRSDPQGHVLSGIGTFAAGILTGAALAVLFAPKPGAELRQEIGTRIRGLGDKIVRTEAGRPTRGNLAPG